MKFRLWLLNLMKSVALSVLYLFYAYLQRCIKNSAVFRSRSLNYQDIYKSVIKAKCFDFGIAPQKNVQGKRLTTENSKQFFQRLLCHFNICHCFCLSWLCSFFTKAVFSVLATEINKEMLIKRKSAGGCTFLLGFISLWQQHLTGPDCNAKIGLVLACHGGMLGYNPDL